MVELHSIWNYQEILNIVNILHNSGNGGEYYDINIRNGWFNYGTTPKPNSLICWTGGSVYGHVGYVEAVDSTGVWTSEAGSGKSWFGIKKRGPNGEYGGNWRVKGFIYLDEPR